MRMSWVMIAAAAASIVGAPAAAQSVFDGRWSVLIVTEKGTCDRAYRYPVRIARGRVNHADPSATSFRIHGRVTAGGSIRVSVSRGNQRADGTGRLARNNGNGRWKSSKGECSGYWNAERRPE
ncbi:MAG: hypothetical protein GHHEDOFH_02305 [Pseudorhodoplanes sp.]|nr:hypothetical protein [Pseudorhodoplanes sp.]